MEPEATGSRRRGRFGAFFCERRRNSLSFSRKRVDGFYGIWHNDTRSYVRCVARHKSRATQGHRACL